MFELSEHSLSSVPTDALLIEIDCLGHFHLADYAQLGTAFPEVLTRLKQVFEAGQLEPGVPLRIDREAAQVPRLIYLLPTRVHPQGLLRQAYVREPLLAIMNELLKLSARSLSFCRIPSLKFDDWPDFKLHILSTFCHVPSIRLHPLRFVLSDKPVKQVVIFCDGGVRQESGIHRGGYGVVLRWGDNVKELSEGFYDTEPERMELMGAIAGLEALKEPCRVRLHSDSRSLIDPIQNGLMFRHAAQNWTGKKLRNRDLWIRFVDAYLKHDVELVWVKGHVGIEDNERCDQLATAAMYSDSARADIRPERTADGLARPSSHSSKSTPANQAKPKSARNSTSPSESDAHTTDSVAEHSHAEHSVRSQSPTAEATLAVKSGVPRKRPKEPGDPCRNCGTALIRRESRKHSPNAAYWYQWYLFCQSCKRIYHVDAARIERD